MYDLQTKLLKLCLSFGLLAGFSASAYTAESVST